MRIRWNQASRNVISLLLLLVGVIRRVIVLSSASFLLLLLRFCMAADAYFAGIVILVVYLKGPVWISEGVQYGGKIRSLEISLVVTVFLLIRRVMVFITS
jgi:hypothetical protein